LIELLYPFNLVLNNISKGEIVVVEYNTLANVDMLPFYFLKHEKSILIIIGDRLALKLMNLIKILGIEIKGSIILISNNPIEIEGVNIKTVRPISLNMFLSEIYEYLKKNEMEDGIVVFWGTDQIDLYFDINEAVREIAKLKGSMPDMTIIDFVNFESIEKRLLSIIESGATTIFRLEGKLKDNGIERRIAVLKSINPIEKEVSEYELKNPFFK